MRHGALGKRERSGKPLQAQATTGLSVYPLSLDLFDDGKMGLDIHFCRYMKHLCFNYNQRTKAVICPFSMLKLTPLAPVFVT